VTWNTPYTLTFEERPGYLYALVEADTIDRNTALAYLFEVANQCSKLGATRLMLERWIPVMLSDSDLFFTTQDFLRMMQSVRVAFLNPYLEQKDDMDFAMTIASNRGAEFRLFGDSDRAESWLRA
jgi:hypothetical protein